MEDAEHFKRKAEEAESHARDTHREMDRDAYLKIAAAWRDLQHRAEARGKSKG